jgi:hypothetical protein
LQVNWPDVELLENVDDERVLLSQQAKEKVLGSYVLVISAARIFPRLDERTTHPGVEIVSGQDNLLATS